MEENSKETLVRDFESNKSGMPLSPKIIAIALVIVAVGIGTGFMLNKVQSPGSLSSAPTSASSISKGQSFGSNDTTTFKDTAEGTLQAGGIDGEGQYHLVRPGGDSQNVYLTSALVDLSLFKGKQIKVWGQTQAAQHAGWLMDVGRVEAL